MTIKNEKRSSARIIGKQQTRQGDQAEGVGGRQACPSPSAGGGGYLDICTVLNFPLDGEQKKRDPRLEELREIGLHRALILCAEQIGVDDFLHVWRIIVADEHVQQSAENYGRMMVPIPSYGTYLRYQRNRYIRSLNSIGMGVTEIKKKLFVELGEDVSRDTVWRATKHQKARAGT